jgi:hypothetical protein
MEYYWVIFWIPWTAFWQELPTAIIYIYIYNYTWPHIGKFCTYCALPSCHYIHTATLWLHVGDFCTCCALPSCHYIHTATLWAHVGKFCTHCAFVCRVKVLFEDFPQGTKENHLKLQSGYRTLGVSIEPDCARIPCVNANQWTEKLENGEGGVWSVKEDDFYKHDLYIEVWDLRFSVRRG